MKKSRTFETYDEAVVYAAFLNRSKFFAGVEIAELLDGSWIVTFIERD